MAAAIQELHSFVGKFTQLCAEGLVTELNFKHSNNGISVSLSANIGSIDPFIAVPTESRRQNCSRSQLRRRRRRTAQFRGKLASQNEVHVEPHNCDELNQPSQVTDTDVITNERAEHLNSTGICDLENFGKPPSTPVNCIENCSSVDFGVSDILNELRPRSNLSPSITTNKMDMTDELKEPRIPQEEASVKPISKTEFFRYMESFSTSLGHILEKKLSGILEDPT